MHAKDKQIKHLLQKFDTSKTSRSSYKLIFQYINNSTNTEIDVFLKKAVSRNIYQWLLIANTMSRIRFNASILFLSPIPLTETSPSPFKPFTTWQNPTKANKTISMSLNVHETLSVSLIHLHRFLWEMNESRVFEGWRRREDETHTWRISKLDVDYKWPRYPNRLCRSS